MKLPRIEKGVPLPEKQGEGFTALLRKMQIGDSFLVTAYQGSSIRTMFYRMRPLRFKSRILGDGNMRIWRVE